MRFSAPERTSRNDRITARAVFGGGERWSLAAILALCAVLISLRWGKMDSLYNIDPSVWLFQIERFARGEMPYRDFSWNYPPLTIVLLGWAARGFGATFAVIQTAMDVISLIVVLLSWWLARYVLSPSTRFVTVAAVVAICSTSLSKFNLFSFSTYSPSLEIAAAGLLMLMVGGVRQLQRGTASAIDFGLVAGGVFIASATKPEAAVAAWGALIILFAVDRSSRSPWYAAIAAVSGFASASVYLAMGLMSGFQDLKDGVTGYGLASFACPWWPTGLGGFGAAAAIGEAVFAAAILLWPFRSTFTARHRHGLRNLWFGGVAGLLVFLAYTWNLCADILLSGEPMRIKLDALARGVVWTSPALLPVMWASICVWIGLMLYKRRLNPAARVLCFVLTVPVIMSVRSLFGTTLFPYTEVSAMCYPFLVVVAAYLIEALYKWALPRPTVAATVAISILLGGYSAVRFIAAYPSQLSGRDYYSLRTNAGTVRLSDNHISEQIYLYILSHTTEQDTLLDLPYGGGFNFATRLASPTFTTQFQQLRMPLPYQLRDLDGVRKTPPGLVIADRGPHFQTEFGYIGNMNCAFPRLVWRPTEPSWNPDYVFPAIEYIEQNYRVLADIGPKLIFGPAGRPR